MGRLFLRRNSLRVVAAAAAALVAWAGDRAAQAAGADAAVTCGDLVSCVGSCIGGSSSGAGGGAHGFGATGDFCGNFVSVEGGCASGYEMWWFGAQYMLWQRDGFALPPLVTASPMGIPDADRGILGLPTTTILAGNQTVSDHLRSGFALEGGFWLNPHTGWGIGLDYFNAGRDSYGFEIGPDNMQTFARPFFNAQNNAQDASLINEPNIFSGTIAGSAFDDFQGAGALMRKCIWSRGNGCTAEGSARLSMLGGYRYYHQDSLIYVREEFIVVDGANIPGTPDGTQHFGQEKFAGRNEFHGAELGLEGRLQRRRWWLEGLAAVAVGPTRRVMFVEGSQLNVDPSGAFSLERGNLLVSEITNFGRYTDDEWQAIPRFRIGAGWQWNEWVGLKFGYNVIVWNVVQAADHLPPGLEVDIRNLPPIQAGGGPEPLFPGIRETTMVAHGLDLGLELSF